MNGRVAIAWTTFADAAAASAVARQLVDEGLVACAQVETAPIRSVYRWEGEIETADEYRVMLKLPSSAVDRLRARLHELHPYDVPEFVVLEAAASEAYARWVDSACS